MCLATFINQRFNLCNELSKGARCPVLVEPAIPFFRLSDACKQSWRNIRDLKAESQPRLLTDLAPAQHFSALVLPNNWQTTELVLHLTTHS